MERDLAASLSVLSIHLSATGDKNGALAAIRECAEIFYRLTEVPPGRFESDLAGILINLSNRLSDVGDNAEALKTVREAVEIRCRLARAQPARYEPDLARSLNNLSNRLSDSGTKEEALAAIREAANICASSSAVRASPVYTRLGDESREPLGGFCGGQASMRGAMSRFRRPRNLVRPYAQQWPESRHMELLKYIESMLKS